MGACGGRGCWNAGNRKYLEYLENLDFPEFPEPGKGWEGITGGRKAVRCKRTKRFWLGGGHGKVKRWKVRKTFCAWE